SGVYGFTLAMVGIFDLTMSVGTIWMIPPMRIATVARMVSWIGRRSSHGWNFSPFRRCVLIGARAGASASSSWIALLARTVFTMLYTRITIPIRYMVPPMARIQYIGMILLMVSMKLPYVSVPSGLNCFHIEACVNPATYIGKV